MSAPVKQTVIAAMERMEQDLVTESASWSMARMFESIRVINDIARAEYSNQGDDTVLKTHIRRISQLNLRPIGAFPRSTADTFTLRKQVCAGTHSFSTGGQDYFQLEGCGAGIGEGTGVTDTRNTLAFLRPPRLQDILLRAMSKRPLPQDQPYLPLSHSTSVQENQSIPVPVVPAPTTAAAAAEERPSSPREPAGVPFLPPPLSTVAEGGANAAVESVSILADHNFPSRIASPPLPLVPSRQVATPMRAMPPPVPVPAPASFSSSSPVPLGGRICLRPPVVMAGHFGLRPAGQLPHKFVGQGANLVVLSVTGSCGDCGSLYCCDCHVGVNT
jgi:hypothetical protein